MIDREYLKDRFGITDESINNIDLSWNDLDDIAIHHKNSEEKLKKVGNLVLNSLREENSVHLLKFRVKGINKLIEKIIRKCNEKDYNITTENYTSHITDLIGVRAIHLYKSDWIDIDNHIRQRWDLNEEQPTAYVRKGDSAEYVNSFKNNGCEVEYHPHGYRSVHYIIDCSPFRGSDNVEIQVRTLFEEGWCEIDHRLRYKSFEESREIIDQQLSTFNRIAGAADEMGTFVKDLKSELNRIQTNIGNVFDEHPIDNESIKTVRANISNSNISKDKKREILRTMDNIQNILSSLSNISGIDISDY